MTETSSIEADVSPHSSVELVRARPFRCRLTSRKSDIEAAQALRFSVFNLELNEGLIESFESGLDADEFDPVCDHLIIEDERSNLVVGTYRLQTGLSAAAKIGYYSQQEFAFELYEPIRSELIELGRACVHKDHRNLIVLSLLWKGIAKYASERQARYLIGCSSLTSQDHREGASMYESLKRRHLVTETFRTRPLPEYACPLGQPLRSPPEVPKLLASYLTIGAKICGPPAIDRRFKTIDFLTMLDLQSLTPRTIKHFLT